MVTIPHLKNLHVTPHSAPAKSIRPGSTPQPWRSCWSPRCSCCRPTAAVANAPRTAGPKPTASDPRGNRRWWWRHSQGFLPGTWWTKLWITGYTHIFRKKTENHIMLISYKLYPHYISILFPNIRYHSHILWMELLSPFHNQWFNGLSLGINRQFSWSRWCLNHLNPH